MDLDQQILTAMVGEEPVFATLVSSGKKSPTPKGVFRIRTKQAVGAMSSSPGADDFYAVEAVPFVQYFYGSFALHGAYWHQYFGRPISHGCVNLSPKDAQHVFTLTAPEVADGWVHVRDASLLGTAVIDLGGGRRRAGDPIDHAVGLECFARHGDPVQRGQPLLRVHADGDGFNQIEPLLADAIEIEDSAPAAIGPLIYDWTRA